MEEVHRAGMRSSSWCAPCAAAALISEGRAPIGSNGRIWQRCLVVHLPSFQSEPTGAHRSNVTATPAQEAE